MKRGLFACAAIVAVQSAWAVVPTDYPAEFSVTERHRMTLVATMQDRTVTQTRRFRNQGTVLLQDADTLFVSGADPEGGTSECVYTHTRRSSLRFRFTEASQQEFRDEFARLMEIAGIPGTTSVTCREGRLTFSRSGNRVTGRQVNRLSVRGRYRNVPFRIAGPWVITWRGARV